jgi:hypothetical protein
MTSRRKIEANRANAQNSTGPTTAHGKARAARNAGPHGLNRSVFADPVLSQEVEAMAARIAGENATTRSTSSRAASQKLKLICSVCGLPAIKFCPIFWTIPIITVWQTRGKRHSASPRSCGLRRRKVSPDKVSPKTRSSLSQLQPRRALAISSQQFLSARKSCAQWTGMSGARCHAADLQFVHSTMPWL